MINAVVGIALVPILWGILWLGFWVYDNISDWWTIHRWHKDVLMLATSGLQPAEVSTAAARVRPW